MINIIRFLKENPYLVIPLKEQKTSLIGVLALEHKEILGAFNEELYLGSVIWS